MTWYTIICDNGPYEQSVYLDGKISKVEAYRFFDIAFEFEKNFNRVSLFKGKIIGKLIKEKQRDDLIYTCDKCKKKTAFNIDSIVYQGIVAIFHCDECQAIANAEGKEVER